jgi:mannose-6-phosphate isomerase-like protein (cupin superfamily)
VITEDGCLVVGPGEGSAVGSTSGAPTLLKAGTEATAGLALVFEQTAPAGARPLLHVHHEAAEMFLVLEGELTFTAGTREFRAPSGTFVYVPKGVAHTYRNPGPGPARIVFWYTPAARMEGYFEELARMPAGPLDRDLLDSIAARHGVEIVEKPD